MKAIEAPFTKGVNFTHWMGYKNWESGNPDHFLACTEQDFINAKSLGCDVIRYPIFFEWLTSKDSERIVRPFLFEFLDQIVEWSKKYDLYAIFDFHNDTRADSATSPEVESVLIPVWKQVAERYKNAYSKIVYELMNEPHNIDVETWNGIIDRVFKVVRSIDKEHYIIAGGADWNSFKAMKTLPDFNDDKVIYTFHFYDPHLFTHQGAGWCHMEKILDIPFPYDKNRMPVYTDAVPEVQKDIDNYAEEGTVESVSSFFDQYVEFSQMRKAPVYCGEFGAYMPYINKEERLNWYRIVTNLLEEKGIARTSWDYYGGFGIFNFFETESQPKFPEDLNIEIVKALKLNVPK